MTGREKLFILKSRKVKSITNFTNELHNLVADLYEALMDDDIHSVKKTKGELVDQVSNMKVDFQ